MDLTRWIREVPDYPKPGVLFRDITPLLAHPPAFNYVVDMLIEELKEYDTDAIGVIDARGFLFGAPVAYALGLPLIPFRKAAKLPPETVGVDFDLEYGTDRIELNPQTISPPASRRPHRYRGRCSRHRRHGRCRGQAREQGRSARADDGVRDRTRSSAGQGGVARCRGAFPAEVVSGACATFPAYRNVSAAITPTRLEVVGRDHLRMCSCVLGHPDAKVLLDLYCESAIDDQGMSRYERRIV